MAIGKRIKAVRKYFKISSTQFANELGIVQSTFSSIENGHHRPSVDMLEIIYNNWNVSPLWLLTGRGGMFEEDAVSSDIEPILYWLNSLSKDEQAWIKIELSRKIPEFKEFLDDYKKR